MSDSPTTSSKQGMGRSKARRMEFAIIGLGLLALVMIFQPFSLTIFAIGSGLVVLAGLVNNLLPLAQPDVRLRSVAVVAMVVAMIFCIVVLLSIVAAYFYGVFFLKPPDPNTVAGKAMLNAVPFYKHGFTWSVAAVAAVLAGLITAMNRSKA